MIIRDTYIYDRHGASLSSVLERDRAADLTGTVVETDEDSPKTGDDLDLLDLLLDETD